MPLPLQPCRASGPCQQGLSSERTARNGLLLKEGHLTHYGRTRGKVNISLGSFQKINSLIESIYGLENYLSCIFHPWGIS